MTYIKRRSAIMNLYGLVSLHTTGFNESAMPPDTVRRRGLDYDLVLRGDPRLAFASFDQKNYAAMGLRPGFVYPVSRYDNSEADMTDLPGKNYGQPRTAGLDYSGYDVQRTQYDRDRTDDVDSPLISGTTAPPQATRAREYRRLAGLDYIWQRPPFDGLYFDMSSARFPTGAAMVTHGTGRCWSLRSHGNATNATRQMHYALEWNDGSGRRWSVREGTATSGIATRVANETDPRYLDGYRFYGDTYTPGSQSGDRNDYLLTQDGTQGPLVHGYGVQEGYTDNGGWIIEEVATQGRPAPQSFSSTTEGGSGYHVPGQDETYSYPWTINAPVAAFTGAVQAPRLLVSGLVTADQAKSYVSYRIFIDGRNSGLYPASANYGDPGVLAAYQAYYANPVGKVYLIPSTWGLCAFGYAEADLTYTISANAGYHALIVGEVQTLFLADPTGGGAAIAPTVRYDGSNLVITPPGQPSYLVPLPPNPAGNGSLGEYVAQRLFPV